MKEIFGEYIRAIYRNEDNTYLAFIRNDRRFWVYETIGDCCSYSWFESINNPENIIGERIIGIEIKFEDGSLDEQGRFIKSYGWTFKTQKGYTDIEFRNASNGYYEGECWHIYDAKLIFPETSSSCIEPTIILIAKNGGVQDQTLHLVCPKPLENE